MTGGGDQVKTTRLWSASASNPSGEPEGAKEEVSGAPSVFNALPGTFSCAESSDGLLLDTVHV